MKKIILYFLISIGSLVSFAQQIVKDSVYFSSTDSYRQIKVWLPEDYSQEKHYHAIYCFDASLLFNMLFANVELYSNFKNLIPPAIVVGIYFDDRNEDMGINWKDGTLNARGEAFKTLVKKDIIPRVEEKYNVSSYRTIVGHSNSTTYAQSFLGDDSSFFQGYLTLSQFSLESDSALYAELSNNLQEPIDFVYVTGENDAEYRVASGYELDTLLNGVMTNKFFAGTHVLCKGGHLTMLNHGLSLGLEVLYADSLHADTLWKQMYEEISDPLRFVEGLVKKRETKYGMDMEFAMQDLDQVLDLYILRKDSLGIIAATRKYAEMFQDSSEYFCEAQCLEMMGAYHAAEKSYVKHLDYYCCPGYWSFIRLAWLYRVDLNRPEDGMEVCFSGLKRLEDLRFLKELKRLADADDKLKREIIKRLKRYKDDYLSTALRAEIDVVINQGL